MNELSNFLQSIALEAITEREKGDRFERLIRDWLVADPVWKSQIETVWLWEEFPERHELGSRDLGIDLVARTIHGEYWAIQCKFHGSEAKVDKSQIDSFISNSSRLFTDTHTGERTGFTARLWVSINETWGTNALEAVSGLTTPFKRVQLTDLLSSQVDWESLLKEKPQQHTPKQPYDHQREALEKAITHYASNDRGQLIMACGTGKTFTSLLIAQKLLENSDGKPTGTVLFLVPSISLLNQSLNAWMSDTEPPMQAICVCSDAKASRKKSSANANDDTTEELIDLALPASTNSNVIAANYVREWKKIQKNGEGLLVVFSTYQSIERVHEAQLKISEKIGMDHKFDLIICDEAHRTTGVMGKDKEHSDFIKVHDNSYIRGDKRLYMTATPRLYANKVKAKASEADYELCSMDDKSKYGREFHRVGFGYAVSNGLLTDYRVLIMTVGSEWQLPPELKSEVENPDSQEYVFTPVSKLVGCINGLAKNTKCLC